MPQESLLRQKVMIGILSCQQRRFFASFTISVLFTDKNIKRRTDFCLTFLKQLESKRRRREVYCREEQSNRKAWEKIWGCVYNYSYSIKTRTVSGSQAQTFLFLSTIHELNFKVEDYFIPDDFEQGSQRSFWNSPPKKMTPQGQIIYHFPSCVPFKCFFFTFRMKTQIMESKWKNLSGTL